MATIHKIESYKITYWGADTKYSIKIVCYKRGSSCGELMFNSGPVVDQDTTNSDGYVRINFPYSDFSNIYSILLHEKPVYIRTGDSGTTGCLTTDTEAIGQEEEDIGSE